MNVSLSSPLPMTAVLADWAASLGYADLPVEVQQRTKSIVFDAVANAYAGLNTSEIEHIRRLATRTAGIGEATVIGSADSFSPVGAVMLNGYLITAATGCDVHRPTTCHVMPEVLPPALAVAEEHDIDGAKFLAAVAAGAEVTTRIGNGLDPSGAFGKRGWHTPGIIGPFGGAAAAGVLLGLDAVRMNHALGLAGSQAGGTYAQFGSPAIKFQQSRGALGGLLSAILASEGFTAAEDVLMSPAGGLFLAFADGGRPERTLDGLGDDWELMRISLRVFPCGVRLQAAVTGILDVMEQAGARGDSIVQLRVGLPETAFHRNGAMPWTERFQARLSAPYVAGVVAMDGTCHPDQFTDERISDPATNQFIRDRIVVEPAPELSAGVKVSLVTRDGRRRDAVATVAKGDPELPLAWSEIEVKFRSLVTPVIGEGRTDALVELLSKLESVSGMTELTGMLRAR